MKIKSYPLSYFDKLFKSKEGIREWYKTCTSKEPIDNDYTKWLENKIVGMKQTIDVLRS